MPQKLLRSKRQKKFVIKKFNDNDVRILNSTVIYQGFCRLEKYLLKTRLFSGDWSPPYEREILVKNNAVAALLYDPKIKSIVLVEQFRLGAYKCGEDSPWLLEIAAGQIPHDMTNEEALAKEVFEETGLTVENPTLIYHYYISPGLNSEKMFLYYAEVDSSQVKNRSGVLVEHEDIVVRVISLDEVLNFLSSGKIQSAVTIIAIQWLEKVLLK